MAANTPNKRLSAMNVKCPWRRTLPLPTGGLNAAGRQHVIFMYELSASKIARPRSVRMFVSLDNMMGA